MTTPVRTVFFGSDPIALPVLEWLKGAGRSVVDLVGVVTQPDRPHGRGMKLRPNAVKAWASDAGLEIRQPGKPGVEEVAWLRENDVALVLVMAYGHLLKRRLIEAPRFPMLNLHASLLPRYRGASPIPSAIAAGESETGVSLMQLVRRMDAGPVYDQERVAIASDDDSASLAHKIGLACVPLLQRALPPFLRDELVPEPQDDALATYTRLLARRDGALDFHAPATVLSRRVRALRPWPGSFMRHEGRTIRIGWCGTRPAREEERTECPGTVFAAEAEGLPVLTGEGVLLLHELQRPGGRMLTAKEFLRGYPVPPKTVLESDEMRPLIVGAGAD